MKKTPEYTWTIYPNPSAQFYCINDIRDVIAGKKPENPDNLWVNAGEYAYGLGNGSIDTIQGLGEEVLINGVSYTKSADQSSKDYYQLAYGEKFMTSWAFLMSKQATPDYNLHSAKLKHPLSILEIYQIIYQKLKKPFFITGILQCQTLKSAAIAKAPIDGLNIFEHPDIYYPEKSILSDQCVGMIGVVADLTALPPDLAKKMHKVVYSSPLEGTENRLTTHEHGVVLNQELDNIQKITPHHVKDIQHLFTDTLVTKFNLTIYLVSEGHMAQTHIR